MTSRIPYVVAAVILAGGVAGALYHAATNVSASVEAMPRIQVPGKAVVPLSEGRHTVFSEGDAPRADLHCTVTNPEGADVPLQAATLDETYDTAGYRGRSLWDLQTLEGGDHLFECRGPAATLAVGHGSSVGDLLPAILVAGASLMAAVVIFLVTFIRRRSAKRK